MNEARTELNGLVPLLDRLRDVTEESETLSVEDVLDAVGRRSFGPLLLLAGLIAVSPLIGDIPGVPTLIGVFVVLVAGQLLVGRKHFWLPRWLVRRSIAPGKLRKAAELLRRPARFVDRLLKVRITVLTEGAGVRVIALACTLIGAAMPVMEVVPFSATAGGLALTAFGLALVARDGLLAALALAFVGVVVGLTAFLI